MLTATSICTFSAELVQLIVRLTVVPFSKPTSGRWMLYMRVTPSDTASRCQTAPPHRACGCCRWLKSIKACFTCMFSICHHKTTSAGAAEALPPPTSRSEPIFPRLQEQRALRGPVAPGTPLHRYKHISLELKEDQKFSFFPLFPVWEGDRQKRSINDQLHVRTWEGEKGPAACRQPVRVGLRINLPPGIWNKWPRCPPACSPARASSPAGPAGPISPKQLMV